MIAVDTSAILAVLLEEPQAGACAEILDAETNLVISAGTLAEALVVAGHRGVAWKVTTLVDKLEMQVVPVTDDVARAVASAYSRWGKGVNPSKLNLGDCFAYALAKSQDCPLLFIGNDFSKTDIKSAISRTP